MKQLCNGYVATSSGDSTVKIWDVTNNANWILIRTYTGHTQSVWGIEQIDTDTLASDSSDLTIQIWSISTGVTLKTINVSMDLRCLGFISSRNHLASGHENGDINIYDITTGSSIATLIGHTDWVIDLVYISNMDLLASSGFVNDRTIRIWDMTTYATKFILVGHTGAVIGLKLLAYDVLSSGSQDATIKLWNITNGALIRTLSSHTDQILWGIDVDNSQMLLSCSLDQTLKIWDQNTGQVLKSVSTSLVASSLLVLNSTLTSKLFYSFLILKFLKHHLKSFYCISFLFFNVTFFKIGSKKKQFFLNFYYKLRLLCYLNSDNYYNNHSH